ncbi:MAG: cation transporter [Lysobacteraceae bacterium]|nr:MAG: cation transporter [Xanthomonadaceae bacterium]
MFDGGLTTEMLMVLGLVAFTMAMFTWDRLRPDLTALLVLVSLGLTGLVPAEQLFNGFAGNAVISVMATMILGAGLDRAGVLNRLAIWLLRLSGGLERRLILASSLVAGLLSGFMQNPAVTSLFLPVASRLSTRTGVPLARLLMPIAACVVMGGGLSMVGNSPLILLNDLIESANRNLPSGVATLKPLGMFAPLPAGLALLVLGLAYFGLFGRRLLRDADDKSVAPGRTESYFARTYGIEGEVFELTVTAESPLVGMSVGDAESNPEAPLLLALKTGNEARLSPPADSMIWVGSVLGVMGRREQVSDYAQNNLLRMSPRLRHFADLFNPARAGISEAVVPPTSPWIGKTSRELQLRKAHGLSLLAINRGSEVFREDVRDVPIRAGDLLVLHSFWRDLALAAQSRNFVVVTDYPKEEQRPHKLLHAVLIFLGAIALTLSGHLPVPVALMTGVVAMLLAGVLTMDEAYAAVSWKTVFIMAALIPLGWAMDSSGAAAWIAAELFERFGELPRWLLLFLTGMLTSLFGLMISNVGATVIMVPMAINLAISHGDAPLPYALVVALCASNNLISVSNPVLAMVSGPAGFRGVDLLRLGLPLSALYVLVATTVIGLVYR